MSDIVDVAHPPGPLEPHAFAPVAWRNYDQGAMTTPCIALVTGASRGIGAATARKLAEAGCDVAVNYHQNGDAAQAVVDQVNGVGQRAVAIPADMGDTDEAERLVRETSDQLGGPHVLVNNAGHVARATLDELSLAEWRRMMAVTLDGAFVAAQRAAEPMKAAGWGRIVNVSSLRAMAGYGRGAHYATAKAGLWGFTKALATELGPHGITANTVSPGYTETDITREAIRTKGDEIRAKIPVGHVAQPEEIGALIAFLCGDEAGSINGATINANGGLYMD